MFHILVVEDDAKLRSLFCTVLNRSGYLTVPASGGREALELLDSEYIDLIISDIMMPGMDGYELIRTLRGNGYSLPILIITAKERFEDKQEGFQAGTDDYMVKQTGKIVAKLESAKNLINTALCETIIIKNLKDVDLGNSHNQLNM